MKSEKTRSIALVIVIIAAVAVGIFAITKIHKSNSSTDSSTDISSSVTTTDNSLNPDNKSSDYISKLAEFMTEKGMKLYGASWCTHCKAQKEVFGATLSKVSYVECYDETKGQQNDTCNALTFVDSSTGKSVSGIQGYPTWVYNGIGYSGEQSITELAKIVGFTDSSSE